MQDDTLIARVSFTLSRDEVVRALDAQRLRAAKVIEAKTRGWRRLRWGAFALVIAMALASVKVTNPLALQAGMGVMLVLALLIPLARWRIRVQLQRLGTEGKVSARMLLRTLEKRVFKGRSSLPSAFAFHRDHIQIQQGEVSQTFAYEDPGLMMTLGDGLLQIIPDEDRGDVADVIFFLPARELDGLDEVAQQFNRVPYFYLLDPQEQAAAAH